MASASDVNVPKTQDPIFTIGVEMIQNTQDFETGVSEWFECPAVKHV